MIKIIIFMAITILHPESVTLTMQIYKTSATIWSQTEITTNRKYSIVTDAENITTTNIPESFTYMANTLHILLNISLENLVYGFNISDYVGNCTDFNEYEGENGSQCISYDGECLQELEIKAWELHAEFKELIKDAMRFTCTENETIAQGVVSRSRIYVQNCTEFMVILNGSAAATGEVGVLGSIVNLYRNSIKDVKSMSEFAEHMIEMKIKEAKIDEINQHIKQQFEEMFFLNKSSVFEITVAEQKKLLNLLNSCLEKAANMSERKKENPFMKAITSSNISHFFDANYWTHLIENETQGLQTFETELTGSQLDQFVLYNIKSVMTASVLVVGMAGNGLLLTIFIRHKETRTLPNSMLINLTIVDCISLVINLLLDYLRVITPWQFGLLGCKLFFYFRYVFVGVSTYSVVMISVQRFAAIRQLPSLVWCHHGKKTKYVLIAAVWGLGFILSVPHAVIADIRRGLCFEISFSGFGAMSTADLFVFCVVPLIIATVFSALTAYRIRRSIHRIPGEGTGQEKLKHNRVVSSTVLVALVLLFVVSYTPDFLLKFLTFQMNISVPVRKFNLVNVITYYLRFVNCCLNPIVLFVMSTRYRGYIKRYCGQRKVQPASKSESSTETSL